MISFVFVSRKNFEWFFQWFSELFRNDWRKKEGTNGDFLVRKSFVGKIGEIELFFTGKFWEKCGKKMGMMTKNLLLGKSENNREK